MCVRTLVRAEPTEQSWRGSDASRPPRSLYALTTHSQSIAGHYDSANGYHSRVIRDTVIRNATRRPQGVLTTNGLGLSASGHVCDCSTKCKEQFRPYLSFLRSEEV
ncbi:hypothetical protein HPB50_027202 [Hyalomma asiaticum]|uniref:Uncharacterized protein n=1 Tax=Hyalomma asiaticum TaxID=266040 RepID=A0ACB7TP45_HYAAI|nr:hypothetical protein HPB50_027202 [Hyalomma asiaticum]